MAHHLLKKSARERSDRALCFFVWLILALGGSYFRKLENPRKFIYPPTFSVILPSLAGPCRKTVIPVFQGAGHWTAGIEAYWDQMTKIMKIHNFSIKLFEMNRKMGLNWPLRGRKNLKIRLPESFLIPRRLARSPGPPRPLKTSKNRFFWNIEFCNFSEIYWRDV